VGEWRSGRVGEQEFVSCISYYASKSNTKTGRMPIPQEVQKN